MPIKDIMVLCDASDSNDHRVETTLSIAKAFNAHVRGMYLVPYPTIPLYGGPFPEAIPYTATEQRSKAMEIAERLKATFTEKATQHNIAGDWVTVDGMDIRVIVDYARYNDLVIVPQGYSSFGEEFTQKFDDYLALHMGRPMIVMPDLKKVFGIPKNITIAWNESLEATRAVHDALPLLSSAENVQVISVSNSEKEEKAYMVYSNDLRQHLRHHSISADVVSVKRSIDGTGASILQAAQEFDTELLVMGAYGHSRLREIVLGGTTNFMLKHATMPLFLSH